MSPSSASTATPDTTASVPGGVRTSASRSKGVFGTRSHQGGMPTARTTACQPAASPSVGLDTEATLTARPRLPVRTIWSYSGRLQHTAPAPAAPSSQGQSRPSERRRSAATASAPRATARTASAGGTNANWHWAAKLATATVTGSSRQRPQATDQPRKISAVSGRIPAAGFQMSW